MLMLKLLMSWDIRPGREAEYFEFVMKEFAPGLMRLGLEPTEAWYTMYGDCPQVLTGSVAKDMVTIQDILTSEEWQNLYHRLLGYVSDYRHKVIHASGGFQL
ncbi:MAG: hypothetical protein JW850_06535 [Thermoflexales bacterium]|nr:hypothetical protein [Thermoflexales bacterium]